MNLLKCKWERACTIFVYTNTSKNLHQKYNPWKKIDILNFIKFQKQNLTL